MIDTLENAPDELAEQFVDAALMGRLVVLCGAGLSIHSGLPLASELAETLRQRYASIYGGVLPDGVPSLEEVAGHFYGQGWGVFRGQFIETLVPWDTINSKKPNSGHEALADFLCCEAAQVVITTNYDMLIEEAVRTLGKHDLDACLDAADLQLTNERLVKVHGCSRKDRANTVWCVEQLDHEPVSDRITSVRTWLGANLQERNVVIVGFWSDWTYLNDAFAASVNTIEPNRVVIVDPADTDALRDKAPQLWAWADNPDFEATHLKMGGHDFLAGLRRQFGARIVYRTLLNARGDYPEGAGACPSEEEIVLPDDDNSGYYNLRRDLAGARYAEPSTSLDVEPGMLPVGVAILYLQTQGAEYDGACFVLTDLRIRIVRGDGRPVSAIRRHFSNDVLDPDPPDYVVCAGATEDGGAKTHLVRGEEKPTIARKGYSQAKWCLLDQLIEELDQAIEQ